MAANPAPQPKIGGTVPLSWSMPLAGNVRVSQDFGVPGHYGANKNGPHTGLDFAAAQNTTVMSVGAGQVVESGYNSSYGNYIKIRHTNGLYTLYAHLQTRNVSAGMTVNGGTVIGKSGSTGNSQGPHLHFEVRGGTGTYNDAINPAPYLKGLPQATPSPGGGNTGGSSGKAAPVSEKPLTAQDFGFTSAFLAANPEINNLVDLAIKNTWSNAQLQGRIIDTAWYRARSEAQRKYDMGTIQDPATYAEAERKMLEELTRLAKVMGVSTADLAQEAKNAVRNGLSADDYIGFLSVRANYSAEQVGRAGIVQQKILGYANDFGITVGPDEINRMMRDSLGAGSEWSTILDGYTDVFRERAKGLYTGIAPQLDTGATVKDILNPYLSRAAAMLGKPQEQMDPANGMWNRPIVGQTPMTIQDWETKVRTDSTYRWDNGPQALQWARDVGDEFMKAFGART